MGASRAAARARRTPSRARTALVGIGVLALLAVVWFLVLPGDDSGTPSATGRAGIEGGSGAGASGDLAAPTEDGPIETFEVFAPKDPFEPLVMAANGGTNGSSGSRNKELAGLDRTASDGHVGGHSVKLLDAYAEGGRNLADVNVDDTVHTVTEGERFADNFELVSVQGGCVTMLFGDDQFTVCEGEQILK